MSHTDPPPHRLAAPTAVRYPLATSTLRRAHVNAVALLACTALAQVAPAALTQWSGSLDVSDPVFNRPANQYGLSFGATAVAYDAQAFTVTANGEYVFESGQSYDGFILVYAGAFNPSNPMANLVGGGDDFTPDPGSSNPSDANELLDPWVFEFGSKLDSFANGFGALSLQTGTHYTAVTTAYGNSDRGTYVNALGGGPGSVVLGAVPEPATLAALLFGTLGLGARTSKARRLRAGGPSPL